MLDRKKSQRVPFFTCSNWGKLSKPKPLVFPKINLKYSYCNEACCVDYIVQIYEYMIALHEFKTAQTLRLHLLKIELILVDLSYQSFIDFSKYHFHCRLCTHFLVLFCFVFFITSSLILDNCLFVKTVIPLLTLAT